MADPRFQPSPQAVGNAYLGLSEVFGDGNLPAAAANIVAPQLQQQVQQVQQVLAQLQQVLAQLQQQGAQLQQQGAQLQNIENSVADLKQVVLNRTSLARQGALDQNRIAIHHAHVLEAVPHQDTGALPPNFPPDVAGESILLAVRRVWVPAAPVP